MEGSKKVRVPAMEWSKFLIINKHTMHCLTASSGASLSFSFSFGAEIWNLVLFLLTFSDMCDGWGESINIIKLLDRVTTL